MKAVQREFRAASLSKSGKERSQPSKPVRHNTPRDCPRVTLRLSQDDHARLKEMADGMALATFIRAKVLEEQLPRRKPRSSVSITDKQAAAQILGLLGQSRIANNLIQLAYHANVGALVMDDVAQAQIDEAYDHILLLRQTLHKSCWDTSNSKSTFANALLEHGFCLARGNRRGFVAVDAKGEVYSLSRWLDVKTKDLTSRLGGFADLPDVEDAVALLQGRPIESPQNSTHQRARQEYEAKVACLVTRQRQERTELSEKQEAQRILDLKARQKRLPSGLKATWARLTGQYQRICKQLAEEAKCCSCRDQQEQQALIDRHLAERRSLDRSWAFVVARHAFEQEFRDRSARVSSPQYQPDPNQPLILPRGATAFTPEQLKRQPDLILTHLSEKKACFARNDILRGLAEFIPDPAQLRAASDKALASAELVKLTGHKGETFTTRAFQSVELELQQRAKYLAQRGGFRVNRRHIDAAIERQYADLRKRVGASLSTEQINPIHPALSANQLCAVVGLAGTGKSTLLATARDAWERQGYHVHGAALAGKAADGLQSASGIPSRTLASLEASWKSGYEPIGCGDVVVIDETGMVGSRQLARVAKQLQQRGCKLILVGDPDQRQPIEAGTPFKDIVENTGASRLIEIRRQHTEWQRQASRDLAEGHTETALQSYADHGGVKQMKDRDQAIVKLVDDYVADCASDTNTKSRLALAHRRKDVHAINQAIRAARKLSGIGTEETLFATDHGPRAFAAGDRILFTRNDATLGVRNGMLGTIEKVGDAKLTIRMDAGDVNTGRRLNFKPREIPSIDHGFAVRIHRSQGCTVDNSYVLSSRTMKKSLTYVALTRPRQETKLYTAPDIMARREKLERQPIMGFKPRPRSPTRSR